MFACFNAYDCVRVHLYKLILKRKIFVKYATIFLLLSFTRVKLSAESSATVQGTSDGCSRAWKWGGLHWEVELAPPTPAIMFIYSAIDRPLFHCHWPFWGLDTRMLTEWCVGQWRAAVPFRWGDPFLLATPLAPPRPTEADAGEWVSKHQNGVESNFIAASWGRLDDFSWDYWKLNPLS